jgi:serine/threonine protein kinase
MLLDYKEGSDLSTRIPVGGFPERTMKGIVAQMCDVLLYLHGRRIVHRDIKPSNVLCENTEDGLLKVCLADFGLAAHVEEVDRISKPCGTPGYLAPEVFNRDWALSSPLAKPEEVTGKVLKTDVFSFGVLIYELALGVNPFVGPNVRQIDAMILRQITANNACGIINADKVLGLSVELQDLLNWSTALDPRNRCSVFDAAGHPWFV